MPGNAVTLPLKSAKKTGKGKFHNTITSTFASTSKRQETQQKTKLNKSFLFFRVTAHYKHRYLDEVRKAPATQLLKSTKKK